MTRWGVVLIAVVLCACRNEAAPAKGTKPTVHVLTSLPLLFEEGFGLEPATGQAATFLRDHYRLKPIDLPSELPKRGVLLAAQPRALPAEELVALDGWVRGGGKMLLLADPLLEWASKRPLGDRLRPPVSFADTGLLSHWGLRLDAPDERGLKAITRGDVELTHNSPGRLVKTGGTCRVGGSGSFAECRVGKGHLIIVADADWLNVEAIKAAGGDPGNHIFALGRAFESLGAKARL